jgi:putative oxidoreductase
MQKIPAVVSWVLRIALAAVFLMAAYRKLSGDPLPVATFEALGLGQWFRVLTGALEGVGAAGLLIPRLSAIAAAGLAMIMVGAAATHVFLIGGSALPAIVLLLALLGVLALGKAHKQQS